ncbi:transposase [Streptomyces klenkii]
MHVATAAARVRALWSHRLPAVHRVVAGPGLNQAPSPGPRRTGCPEQAGLVALCDRPGQRPDPQRRPLTGPNPTDRGKKGSRIHLLVDHNGLPLPISISAANTHDSQGFEPLARGIPPIRSRRGPRRRRPAKLHGDKGYDYPHLRQMAPLPGHHAPRRPPGNRELRASRPAPLDRRTHHRPAGRMPTSPPQITSASPNTSSRSQALLRHSPATRRLPK